jgi:predicted permease
VNNSVLAAFSFILLMLAIGRLIAWRGWVPPNTPEALNQIVLYVCLPAAILLYAPGLHFQRELLGLLLIPWLMLAASVVLVLGLQRWAQVRRDATGALLLTVALGNTSFLGYPIIVAVLGEAALPYAVIYDQFGSFLILSSFGLVVLAMYGDTSRPTPCGMLKRIAGFPPMLALVAALTIMPEHPPEAISEGLKRLSGALLPLVTLAVGMQIRFKLPRRDLLPLGAGLAFKLLLLPLLALALCGPLGLSGDIRKVAVLQAAMPSMITAGALAAAAGLAPELAAALVGYGIVLSLATLPLWLWFLG